MVSEQLKNALLEFSKPEKNIENIYKMNLCNFCGACILVCPVNAIEYGDAQISINNSCIKCGSCLEICSQNQKERYQTELFDRENNDKVSSYYPPFREIHIGEFINLYNCRSNKKEISEHSMVGGTTLTLLTLALEEKLVDAVVVADFVNGNQFPASKVTKDKDTILKSGGSRYLPTLSLKILEQIEKDDSIQSVAITTLPCQAYVLRKLSMKEEAKHLTQKISLIFTLLCGSGLPSKKDVEQFLKKKKVKTDLSKFSVFSKKEKRIWRLNPQAQRRYIFKDKEGRMFDFSSSRILATKSFPNCNYVCPDYSGTQSDVSLGGSGIKSNFVITRTERGERLIQQAVNKKILTSKRSFSIFNRFVIKIMGRRKRIKQRIFYKNHFQQQEFV